MRGYRPSHISTKPQRDFRGWKEAGWKWTVIVWNKDGSFAVQTRHKTLHSKDMEVEVAQNRGCKVEVIEL